MGSSDSTAQVRAMFEEPIGSAATAPTAPFPTPLAGNSEWSYENPYVFTTSLQYNGTQGVSNLATRGAALTLQI